MKKEELLRFIIELNLTVKMMKSEKYFQDAKISYIPKDGILKKVLYESL